ncbi:hypothetical protein OEB99_13785 [Actinotalea sp. M2MS4P-6]|uniref:DUF6544 family protein n=1 Tax=Actinotalea sp. M2MS4P-6 TaxID=2983762 RepID=UPI0021E37C6C|nr:DUF6544 family protein [Actinotalea sp. M2MS4P-6]MCV2395383.1 hypothetical protein [Actinotalea sp. M2MS4P-6]
MTAVPTVAATATRPPARPRRAGDAVRVVVAVLIVLHGLVHLIGVLGTPEGTGAAPGWLWFLAAAAVVGSGVGLGLGRRHWWWLGLPALVLSQTLIVVSWPQAFAGTAGSVVLGAAVLHAWFAEGPRSRRARYRRHAVEVDRGACAGPVVTEADLEPLPAPAARWLRRAGVVGRPRPLAFRAVMRGRIRSTEDAPWMTFAAEQVNTVGDTWTRWFRMDATMRGLPVDVLHVYREGDASMHARVASMVPVVSVEGREMGKAETVTVLNDVCMMAPAALLDAPVTWAEVDDHHVVVRLACGGHEVAATLVLDDAGDLVDFRSEDRSRTDGRTVEQMPWSTPLTGHREMPIGRVAGAGAAVWDAPEGTYTYIETTIDSVEIAGA